MDSFSVKIHRRSIKNQPYDIPDDTLYIIFEKIAKKTDQDSFGLTCHRFLDIQNSCRKRLGILPLSDRAVRYSLIFDKLLNRFRQLESICFHKCHSLTDDALNMVTVSCKSLIQLDFGWCSSITDIGIGYINRNCRQLKTLQVSGCHRILGRTFQGFSPTLNRLEAIHCAFDSTGLASILSGGGLTYLNLSFPVCYPSWKDELAVIGLGYAANLKVLDFSACNLAANDAIIKISKGCPLLQEWNLSGCQSIGIHGWEAIGLYCQNLETLNAADCHGFGNAGFVILAKGCTRLSVLYVTSDGHRITPSGILYFQTQRPAVELYCATTTSTRFSASALRTSSPFTSTTTSCFGLTTS